MNKIKEKIEKLLRLSLSGNPNEAKLAAQKAVELMQRYAIDNTEFSQTRIITKKFEIKYARIPVWLRELYNDLSYINGCYMVWSSGSRDRITGKIAKKAQIFLTGRECDVLNTEYLLHIFIREIERMGEEYKKSIEGEPRKREKIKSYKRGLGEGLCNRLLEATDNLENSQAGKELIAMDNHHNRYMESMNSFIYDKENKVTYIVNEVMVNDDFQRGLDDAENVDIHKPIDGGEEDILIPFKEES